MCCAVRSIRMAGVASRSVPPSRTGMVMARVRTRSPYVSLQIAQRLLEGLNHFNLVTRQSQAREERRLLRSQRAARHPSYRAARVSSRRGLAIVVRLRSLLIYRLVLAHTATLTSEISSVAVAFLTRTCGTWKVLTRARRRSKRSKSCEARDYRGVGQNTAHGFHLGSPKGWDFVSEVDGRILDRMVRGIGRRM